MIPPEMLVITPKEAVRLRFALGPSPLTDRIVNEACERERQFFEGK